MDFLRFEMLEILENVKNLITTDPETGTNSFDMFCLATGAKRSLANMDKMVLYVYLLLSLLSTCLSLSFFHLQFYKRHCFCAFCGNVFICSNVNEAFHLVASPS